MTSLSPDYLSAHLTPMWRQETCIQKPVTKDTYIPLLIFPRNRVFLNLESVIGLETSRNSLFICTDLLALIKLMRFPRRCIHKISLSITDFGPRKLLVANSYIANLIMDYPGFSGALDNVIFSRVPPQERVCYQSQPNDSGNDRPPRFF